MSSAIFGSSSTSRMRMDGIVRVRGVRVNGRTAFL
jgi:hypothetical protein